MNRYDDKETVYTKIWVGVKRFLYFVFLTGARFIHRLRLHLHRLRLVRYLRLARMPLFDAAHRDHRAFGGTLAASRAVLPSPSAADFLDSWTAPSYRCEVTVRVTRYDKKRRYKI